MRTTLTLDPDVVRLLKKTMKERGTSLKETINELIRSGFRSTNADPIRFKQRVVSMGRPRVDLTKASALAGSMEDSELLAKAELGK